jgi:hypothetical protein
VRSLNFYRQYTQESPQIRGFLRVLRSLKLPDSNQNSQFGWKVSSVFLGNSRFAESKSGDWFDLPLDGRDSGIRTAESYFPLGQKIPLLVIFRRALQRTDDVRRSSNL